MVMETTGALQLIVPLMLTVFFAKVGPCFAAIGLRARHARSSQMQMQACTPTASCPLPSLPSQIVGDRYGVGIDDTHVRLRGAPVLDEPALDVHQQVRTPALSICSGSDQQRTPRRMFLCTAVISFCESGSARVADLMAAFMIALPFHDCCNYLSMLLTADG